MRIIIMGAMKEEVDAFLPVITEIKPFTLQHVTGYQGNCMQHEILLIQSGIGKVNSAVTTSLVIHQFQPDLLINIGSAGGLHQDIQIGHVLVADCVSYHDADARAFNDYAYGQIPGMPKTYYPDTQCLNLFTELSSNHTIHRGLICSGDSFVSDEKHLQTIQSFFPNIYAVDMESCSIAQACFLLDTPFCIIRAISDHANQEAPESFEHFLKQAAKHSAELTLHVLTKLPSHVKTTHLKEVKQLAET